MNWAREFTSRGLAALLALAVCPGFAADKVDFNRDIKPILSNKCFTCHGPDDEERKAGLRLDRRDGVVGADAEKFAIVAGKPEVSELIRRVTTSDEGDIMPPADQGKRLTAREVQLLDEWIMAGAKYETHWSYTQIKRPEVPVGSRSKWARGEIDQFILQGLRAKGLTPSPEADRWILARRAAVDLIGLPPTIGELKEFVNDKEPKAFERYVDRLLEKKAFGEHWARQWLDLARYADTAGYPSDPGRTIWAYRDWVIKSYNDNMPFDQFTVEQIAGDMLPNPTESQRIATAFHRNTMTQNEGGTSDEEFRNAAVVDRVNTTMAVWMGTSMACAQCHTHKYDPITQHEYFSFHALLNNTADADKRDESPLFLFYTDDQKKQRQAWEDEVASLDNTLAAPKKEWFKGLPAWEKQFSSGLKWETGKPLLARSQKKTKLEIREDGSIVNQAGKGTDSYTVEVPLTQGSLSAIRIETLPDEGLPAKGPGLSGGNFVISQVIAQIVPSPKSPRSGQIVRVEMKGKGKFVHLAEVQVFSGGTNVALKGSAKQSGDYRDAVASRAIDGNTDGDYYKKSVSHSAGKGPVEFWEVDLKNSFPIDRIHIWNRTDGNTAPRLANYTVKVLDGKRREVWSTTEVKHFPKDKSFAINGPTTIKFRTAVADYEQGGFAASSVILAKPKTGWAVGGKPGVPHQLSLITAGGVSVPKDAKLRLVIRQNSKYKDHLLGRFRIQTTDDKRVDQWLKIPANILAAVGTAKDGRKKEQVSAIRDFYIRNIAAETRTQRSRLASLKKSIAGQKKISVPVMQELAADKGRTNRVQLRGSYQSLGDHVDPGLPSAFHGLPKDGKADRLAMAKWLIDRKNPLTARVTVNRYWENIFGTGLVRTSEEFGAQGELPSHPELLDWLAAEFMDMGWDRKKFLKMLVTSAAYRQSSKVTARLREADPNNRLISRGPRFRGTGEMLRDQALFVSGLLSRKMYGEPVRPERPKLGVNIAFGRSNDWETSKGEDRHRRSIYTRVQRSSPYPSFSTFDAPNREVCTIRRSRSNTPLQAFVTLNDPVFVETAQGLARRIVGEGGKSDQKRLEFAFLTCASRKPSEAEITRLTPLIEEAREVYAADADLAKSMAAEPLGMPEGKPNLTELATWTTVANVVLNLDEMIMRR